MSRSRLAARILGTTGEENRFIKTSVILGQNIKLVEMPEKKTIKIIKKNERGRKEKPASKGNNTTQSAREMVQTVTNWVTELQQKRRVETANAIKLMLSKNPRASEA